MCVCVCVLLTVELNLLTTYMYSVVIHDDTAQDQPHAGLFNGVLPLYSSDYDATFPLTLNDSGKLHVLSRMLEQILSATNEKVVVVSNYTKVRYHILCKNRRHKHMFTCSTLAMIFSNTQW